MKEGVFLLDQYKALGTVWYIEVFDDLGDKEKERLTQGIQNIIVSFENKYSRFKPESLLNILNKERSIPYDKEFADILLASQDANNKSDGIFDIFIKDTLIEKGYGTGGVSHTDRESIFVIDNETIKLTEEKSIDFGGIGKGYLIDLLSNYLKKEGQKYFLINGGGDMYVTENNGEPIKLFLQHPINHDEVIGSIEIKNSAFCSSSSYVRMWQKDGVKHNHFVSHDKKEIWAASYVVGEKATVADVVATVLCIASDNEEKLKQYGKVFGVSYLVYDKDFKPFGDLKYTSLV
jgi:thiamine biosynthesis lipoprotein